MKRERGFQDSEEEEEERHSHGRQPRLWLTKIISGGQDGADIAGLIAGKKMGLTTGGTAPFNFVGVPVERLRCFGLVPHYKDQKKIPSLIERSKRNVDDADVTVAFRLIRSAGTDKTIGYALTRKWEDVEIYFDGGYFCQNLEVHKPVFVIAEMSDKVGEQFRLFLSRLQCKVLNVAGHALTDESVPADWEESIATFLVKHLGN